MNKLLHRALFFILALFLSGCRTAPLSPLEAEDRTVTVVAEPTKTVTLDDPMIWYDQASPSRGIRFPAGTYVLEAQDSEYWYFRAPTPLEYRMFLNGKPVDGRLIPGGLYLKRAAYNVVPAGAYMTDDEKQKTLVWKLGSAFMDAEGSKWRKNFK